MIYRILYYLLIQPYESARKAWLFTVDQARRLRYNLVVRGWPVDKYPGVWSQHPMRLNIADRAKS